MRHPKPLPSALVGRPFSVAEALREGASPGRLRARDLDAPFPGVRTVARGESSFVERVRAVAPRLRDGDAVSHLAALALVGADAIGGRSAVVDVCSRAPLARMRARGVRGHQITEGSVRIGAVAGVPAVHPVDAWCQLASDHSVRELVIVGDALVRRQNPIADREELRRAAAQWSGRRGAKRLREAEALVRQGTDSPRETRLRLDAAGHGLPEPEVNHPVYDETGRLVAILDLAYPEYRVGLEYDGDHHRTDDGQYYRDIERLDALARLGWRHIRVTREHRGIRLSLVLSRVSDALLDRGWRPG
ncbi:hypothetical protein FBY40_0676 [Microbacterium sp. SLBN-154]|uniref:hypothetical protein n=1 Tax=Microbacterium sp. SLBN-154 TaxID=2768458 RepID=UPI00114EF907|nr:hypothetical protein [Microbacterium sp. SLBN-154]TQK18189.1 hypothetical protein FBY40_0676 [Microbacterium sp. SLBN-154]